MVPECVFCTLDPGHCISSNRSAVAVADRYPVTPGHSLIIPRRHIASLFETTDEERSEIWLLLEEVRELLTSRHQPAGFNIGVNEGSAAGQTLTHLHIHLIPRYHGDCPDPRGGVRWIFPDKAAYWDSE